MYLTLNHYVCRDTFGYPAGAKAPYGINFKLLNIRKLNKQGVIPSTRCKCRELNHERCGIICTNSYYVDGNEILVCKDCKG